MFSGIARVFVTLTCIIALVMQPAYAGLDCALTPNHADCASRAMQTSPSGYVYGTCKDGWTLFENKDNSEKNPSCYTMIDYTFGGAYASQDAACAAVVPGSHALSIGSRKKYTTQGLNLLSKVINSLGGESRAAVGCKQDAGASKTGLGWSWSDGTPSNNLVCSNPASMKCDGTFVWGASLYRSWTHGGDGSGSGSGSGTGSGSGSGSGAGSHEVVGPFSREPTDGHNTDTRYDEEHKRDWCVVRPNNFHSADKTFAGLFAAAFENGATVKLFCEYDDTDEDGVFDFEDACPNSPKFARGHVDERGCTRSQADADHDGVCSGSEASVWCDKNDDNCDYAYNPLQTATESSSVGDACNTDGCSAACAYGCDAVAAGRRRADRNSPLVCTSPYQNGHIKNKFRCKAPWKPISRSNSGCYCPLKNCPGQEEEEHHGRRHESSDE